MFERRFETIREGVERAFNRTVDSLVLSLRAQQERPYTREARESRHEERNDRPMGRSLTRGWELLRAIRANKARISN